MKYASVIVPLVLVGVIFLLGCIWVATRGEKDDGDEESALESPEPRPKMTKPDLAMPIPAHVRMSPPHSTSSNSLDHTDGPPRYER
ncbi:hypothetical protein RSOLAG1IB_10912 [Rhizoctonia solani AG-1 IB]|uniref:Uncharacterized protein n=1 Tax=Thanatephorus cucumeris (strain AG1-IB / isolate 7/3/14) TaxID=1108050 RepID=A0A0B7G3G3_THACB|nr:hypothetical protein RSOLAG1IB_10912 [Rhizoctonia solani AG-1 IB]